MNAIADLNLLCGWAGIVAGMVAGATHGLFFHRADWLGGYASWARRLTRLGHISFFGLAFVNLAFVLTVWLVADPGTGAGPGILRAASWCLVVGAVTMPTVCYLAAWRKPIRHAFFVPVGSLVAGAGCVLAFLIERGLS